MSNCTNLLHAPVPNDPHPPSRLHTCHLVSRSLLLDPGSKKPNCVVEVSSVGFRNTLLGSVCLVEFLHVVQRARVWLQPGGRPSPDRQHSEERRKQARVLSPTHGLQQGPGLSHRLRGGVGGDPWRSSRRLRIRTNWKAHAGKTAKPGEESAGRRRHGLGELRRKTFPPRRSAS